MRQLMIIFAAALSITACTSQTEKQNGDDDSIVTDITDGKRSTIQNMCFQKLAGTTNQDTTSLVLIVDGDNVTGDFGHYPYEKDQRVGKIIAKKDRELIKGIWVYMQEGQSDTLQVEFKLNGDKLTQKNYTVDSKTGREVFSEGSVFNIEFNKIPCRTKEN